jgi:hypothetical protein
LRFAKFLLNLLANRIFGLFAVQNKCPVWMSAGSSSGAVIGAGRDFNRAALRFADERCCLFASLSACPLQRPERFQIGMNRKALWICLLAAFSSENRGALFQKMLRTILRPDSVALS